VHIAAIMKQSPAYALMNSDNTVHTSGAPQLVASSYPQH